MNGQRVYPMNAAELLDGAVAIYAKSFGQQIVVTLVMAVVFGVIMLFSVAVLAIVGVVGFVNGLADSVFTPAFILFLALALILVLGVSVILSSATQAANMILTQQVFSGEKPDVAKALSAALRSAPRMFTAALASFLLAIPIYALLGGLIFALVMNTPDYWQTPMYGTETTMIAFTIIVAAASILAFVLTLFAAALCSVAMPVSLFEKRYFFGAVAKSARLVWRDYWWVFGTLALASLTPLGFYYSLIGVFNILSGVIQAFSDSLPAWSQGLVLLISMAGTAASLAANTLIQPFSGIFTALLYQNQKIKHEGLDIQMEIRRLEEVAPIDVCSDV